jgi:hypothetical protein
MSQSLSEKELCACIWATKWNGNDVFYSVEKHGNPSILVKDFTDPADIQIEDNLSSLIYHFNQDGSYKKFFLSCGYMVDQGKWSINKETGDLSFTNKFDGNEILKISEFTPNDKFKITRKVIE